MNREVKMPKGHGEKVRQSLVGKFGTKSRAWKGNNAGYVAIHSWIVKHFGKANKCENPNCKSKNPKRFEHALIKGRQANSRDINDYIMFCPSCHRKYDMTDELKAKIIKNLKRAWDNSWIKKVMIYFGIFDTDEGLYCMDGVTDIRKAKIMQFTGLKDKNGKDIYEGDIVVGCINDDAIDGWNNYEVVYADVHGGYMFENINDKGAVWYQSLEGIEVIGNIYQNKELLK